MAEYINCSKSLLLCLSLLMASSLLPTTSLSSKERLRASEGERRGELREVLVATQSKSRLRVFDVDSLQPLGYFAVNEYAHSVVASPDGLKLFLEQSAPAHGKSCCAFFALDLVTHKLCELIYPSSLGAPTPNGRWVFTQRGNIGIEVFDAKTLTRLPIIDAPGLYQLYPSPDSRWLFGVTYSQRGHGPALDIFDLENKILVRRLPTPEGLLPRGIWLGDQFLLYAHDGNQGNLWKVTPETTRLDSPLKITFPSSSPKERSIPGNLTAGGEHLFLYEGFGGKVDRRRGDGLGTPGGIFSIDPSSGKVVDHLSPSVQFARVIADKDGRFLYGIDSDRTGWGSARLLKIDSSNGAIVTERALEPDRWFFSLAKLPASLVPQGAIQSKPCESR